LRVGIEAGFLEAKDATFEEAEKRRVLNTSVQVVRNAEPRKRRFGGLLFLWHSYHGTSSLQINTLQDFFNVEI
jgi:hypothetical protein